MSKEIKISCRNCHGYFDVSDLEPFSRIPCPECGTMLRIPKAFERYLLEKICGREEDGTPVYRAIDPLLARRVAVKIIRAGNYEEAQSRRFLAGAKAAAGLSHAGLVPVYDCGIWEGDLFLVMRFMENGDFARMQEKEELPSYEGLMEWLIAIGGGLEFINGNHMVHGDVRPSNMMLTSSGEARIGHFDCMARSPVTADGRSPSLNFASPDRLQGKPVGPKSDVFSFGASIYKLVSGYLPFPGAQFEASALKMRLSETPVPIRERRKEISRDFSKFIAVMLDPKPENRPDMKEVVAALKAERERAEARSGSILHRIFHH